MNQEILSGKWTQMKGKIREQWGKLTDDDLDQINGKREQFLGRIQELYGTTKQEAERQLKSFESRYEKEAAATR